MLSKILGMIKTRLEKIGQYTVFSFGTTNVQRRTIWLLNHHPSLPQSDRYRDYLVIIASEQTYEVINRP